MRLTVFGATGGTGRRLLERAIAEGHEATDFVRNPSKMTARHERLKVTVGDAFDPGRVGEGGGGKDAAGRVFCAGRVSHAPHPRTPGDPDGTGAGGLQNHVGGVKGAS